ncbi:hypothetical protein [Pelomonas cellulosilytica]|uniref:Exosortase/archaeosortase family protein n=1 Tax=Pelomonas cellulosilytica TaxID=2906762 RepID=A0ABS8Y2J8_9BURK|nr:hypothetical protein [Pelomonas sp. P8]MCE4557367.1 hypothetical protein [Pelomonas sp. P8]
MRLTSAKSVRMGAIFVLVYALLNWCYFLLPDAQLKRVHEVLILQPCAAVLNSVLDASVGIRDNGLVSDGIYLAVVRGCDGAGVLFLLLAAVACFPSRAAPKLIGLVSGLVLVHVLNVARIVALFVVFKDHRNSFSDLHDLYVPTAMLLICGVAFMLWMSSIRPLGMRAG